MSNITIETVKSSMPKNSKGVNSSQELFLIKQTSEKGRGGTLLAFCSEKNWQDAAIRAADAYFEAIGMEPPTNIPEKIGYGLIALAGQNPHYKETWKRFSWEKNSLQIREALEAAVIAAGLIAEKVRNLPPDLLQKLKQSNIQSVQQSQKIDSGNYVPSDAEIEAAIKTVCQHNSTEEANIDAVCNEIEQQAQKAGHRLHPDWLSIKFPDK